MKSSELKKTSTHLSLEYEIGLNSNENQMTSSTLVKSTCRQGCIKKKKIRATDHTDGLRAASASQGS